MSTQINDGGLAFPLNGHMGADGHFIELPTNGMTLRDWFAGQAIMSATMMENQSRKEPTYKGIATRAYMLADAMIEAREGGKQ
jgi:DNA-directed RNA polymerase delta subunit